MEELEAEAMDFPVESRDELAERLLESLEPSDAEVRKSWIREAERRAEEMRSGRVQGEPVAEVLAGIRAAVAGRAST